MYIGVDIFGPKISIGLVGENGSLSFPSSFPVDPETDCETVVIDLIFSIKTITETVPMELFNDYPEAIGITIHGTIDEDTGVILDCENCSLERVNLKKRLQRNFEIPIHIGSHDNAMAQAAKDIGAQTMVNASVIAAGLVCKYSPNNTPEDW